MRGINIIDYKNEKFSISLCFLLKGFVIIFIGWSEEGLVMNEEGIAIGHINGFSITLMNFQFFVGRVVFD